MKKIIVLILCILLFGTTFANSTFTDGIWHTAISILNILNLIWLPFAILAWKLFTNDFVYGAFMHLDVILWKIWNFSKTIANYALAFILFVSIFWLFIWKVKNIFSVLLKIWVAAILINLSWFLLGFLVDLSTILLVGVGSFPMSMIWQTNLPSPQVSYCTQTTIKYSKDFNNIFICKKQEKINASQFLEKTNSLAGPLVYIWDAILWINKSWSKTDITKEKNPSGKDVAKAITVGMMVQLIATLLFVIPIIILIVIWIIRIFWLWIYIWFSPLIILDQIFWWKMLKDKKEFQLKNIIWLIFQPVFVVFAMWIAVIFLVSIQSAFLAKKTNDWLKQLWVCENDVNSLCMLDDSWKYKKVVTVKGDFMKNFISEVWWAFGYIILFILSTLILWSMIKVATKSSEITASVSENIYKFAEESLKAVPFIPTPFWPVWVGAMEMAFKKRILKSDFQTKAAQQADRLLNALWLEQKTDISLTEKTKFSQKIWEAKNFESWRDALIEQLKTIADSRPEVVPAYAPNFQEEIYKAFQILHEKKWAKESDLEAIWFLKKDKDGKFQEVTKEQLFANRNFQQFLTGLFQKMDETSLSTYSDFHTFYTNVKAGTQPLTTKSVKDIIWKSQ